MGFRLSKLRIFLIIDLILLTVVIPGYFYVDSQISKSDNFEVTDLILESDWIQVGEPVDISVKVTNKGDKTGNHTVALTIDDVQTATETVQLSAGETTTVIFTATEQTEGNYTITIGSMTETLRVTVETPIKKAKLQLTNLVTSRQEAGIGDPITVSVTATNTGDETGEFSLELFVNDQKRQTKSIQLDGGENELVQFEITENSEGDYEVEIGGLTTSFTITSEAQSVKPAEFQVTDLTINPSSALVDEVVTISVKVTNVGEESGTYTVNLTVDGVTRDSKDVTVTGQATDIVEFEVSEQNAGTYTVEVADQSGSFSVESLTPASTNTRLYSLTVSPYEVWGGETVTIKAKAANLVSESSTLQVRILIDGEIEAIKTVTLDADAKDVIIQHSVTAKSGTPEEKTEGYSVEIVNLGNQTNTLRGFFQVAPDNYHTVSITRAGGGSIPLTFELNGVTHDTPYSKLLPTDEYTLSAPRIVDVGTGILEFSHWNDGVETEERTFTLDKWQSLMAYYVVISGYASCPSLYTWNGTGYNYITEVSNAGWLGYIDYITDEGDIVFGGGNPWDHVKLDSSQLQTKNDTNGEYYDIVLFQQWNEIFYMDTAYLVVVDHPTDTDAYSTMVNYVNRGFYGEIYTVDEDNLLTPVSATNQNGEDVLSQIAEIDSIFTQATNGVESPSWDNITLNQLTLDLGDLSDAEEIKLVINGMVDWGPAEPYYEWIDQFKTAAANGLVENGTQINPPAYMEVMDAQGNWVQVPQDRQMPIPGDYVPRTFTVDLNGLFPEDITEYKIRITNFWNVTFDYIGIDTSAQEDIEIYEISATANLDPLEFGTVVSNVSGNFTKYGDVTELLLPEADDMYVIGMQGDKVSLKFYTSELPPLEEGMERSFFMFVACWFKDPVGNWGYEFDFTVDPLPFRDMSGFPYPDTESYPTTEEYENYLQEWNTRTINAP
ncbi:MAG: hypothetical protein NWF06_01175 [Candidatus Bathyarchaeota archaeon]|nr:hypothetical protein [Candidatus Bathyarchaeum sp.]